jgi:formiminotetrahydrofolate cyclodeaminase
MYCEGRFKEYLDDLAAKKPAPGGGSARMEGTQGTKNVINMVCCKYSNSRKAHIYRPAGHKC